jgi:hypothetical protein
LNLHAKFSGTVSLDNGDGVISSEISTRGKRKRKDERGCGYRETYGVDMDD